MDDYKITPFSIILSKTGACVNSYHGETKRMYFLIEDDEKCNDIWNVVSNNIKKEFDSEPIYRHLAIARPWT